jgi:putative flippase GtrA
VRFLAGHSRRPLRFAVVGAWNTVFGYGAFAACYWVTQRIGAHYLWAALPAHVIAVLHAFAWQRWFVFEARGPIVASLLRFSAVYWVFFAINLPLLPLLVQLAGLHPLVAQALLIIANAAVSYVVHDRFTFGKHAASPDADLER